MASLAATKSFVRPLVPHSLVQPSNLQVERGCARVTCRKQGLHPEVYKVSPVVCNGEVVMTTMGTRKEYVVDVWSGNHPFFQGSKSVLLTEAGQVDKFKNRFGNLGAMSEIPLLTKGEIVIVKKGKANPKKGKGKK